MYWVLCWLPLTSFSQSVSPQFEASGLLMLHDADMHAATFAQGTLFRDPAQRDVLSTLSFPLQDQTAQILRSTPTPNSSVRTGKSIAVHPGLKMAYILEHRGSLARDLTQVSVSAEMEDLPTGEFMTLVDFSVMEAPKALFKMPIAKNATSISISPDFQYLAITSSEDEREIEVLELSEDGRPIRIITKPTVLPPGRLVDVQWHPSGEYLAYINASNRSIGVLKTVKDGPTGKIIRIEHGDQTLAVGKRPVFGKFTPDGTFFLVMDAKKSKADYRLAEKGELFAVKLNPDGAHFLLSRCTLGENPTDLAVHPSGRWIAAVNAEKSFMTGGETGSASATMQLISISAQGNISAVRDIQLEGALPMSVVWDKTGRNLITSQYEVNSFGLRVGGLAFWRWQEANGKPQLTLQNGKVFVPRSVHSLISIP